MSDNVVFLGNQTCLDVPPERVLTGALERNLESVVVLGYDAEGNEYFASSNSDSADIVWLMERFKQFLLSDEK